MYDLNSDSVTPGLSFFSSSYISKKIAPNVIDFAIILFEEYSPTSSILD